MVGWVRTPGPEKTFGGMPWGPLHAIWEIVGHNQEMTQNTPLKHDSFDEIHQNGIFQYAGKKIAKQFLFFSAQLQPYSFFLTNSHIVVPVVEMQRSIDLCEPLGQPELVPSIVYLVI